ncbi:MAG: copper chaperone PCu(A)C [Alphaproteobacteria bacterium]
MPRRVDQIPAPKRLIRTGLVLFFLAYGMASATTPALAEESPTLYVTKAYAYATAPAQKNGAVFMTIENPGIEHLSGRDLAVTGVQTDIADRAELHIMSMNNGVMMMREAGQYSVPAGETLALEPTGRHIMLFGLKEPLKAGESFPLTLLIGDGFHHAYSGIPVEVQIVPPGAEPPAE